MKILILLLIFLFFTSACTQFFSDTGDRPSNALCTGVNPTKPPPGVDAFARTQNTDEDCIYSYRRTITLDRATDQDDKQVIVNLSSSNFNFSRTQSDGADIRFLDTDYLIFDHYIDYWDADNETAKIWVRVPSSGTTSFLMHYGSSSATDESSAGNTFAYSTEQTLYFYVQDITADLNISSYFDDNDITVTTSGGDVTQNIDENATLVYSNAVQGGIVTNGAITGRADSTSGIDSITPLTFRGTVFGYPSSRGTDTWDMYNPSSSTANVTIYNYDGSGNLSGSTSFTITSGTYREEVYDVDFGIVESDQNILVNYSNNNGSDGAVLVPAANQLMGVNSNGAEIGITQDSTTGIIYYSDGTSVPFTGDRGDVVAANTGSATQGAGYSVNVVADAPIVAANQADGDGSDTVVWQTSDEMSREYLIPTQSEYLSISSLWNSTITAYASDGTQLDTCDTVSDGVFPHKCLFDSGSTYAAGARVVSDKPFYIYYEHDTQDESTALGPKQGRLLSDIEPTSSVGDETLIY